MTPPRHRTSAPRPADVPAAPRRWVQPLLAVLTVALALALLFAPGSFLTAWTRQLTLLINPESRAWQSIRTDVLERTRRDPAAARWIALERALLVAGREVPGDASVDPRTQLAGDPGNGLTAAAWGAVLIRRGLAVGVSADRLVDQVLPSLTTALASGARTYQGQSAAHWRDGMAAAGLRRDFAARAAALLTESGPALKALPQIVDTWLDLADRLDRAGATASGELRHRLAELCLALLRDERIPANVLLAADLLVAVRSRDQAASDVVTRQTRAARDRLRRAVHGAADAAPADWGALPNWQVSVIDGASGRGAMLSLAAAVVSLMVWVGAAARAISGLGARRPMAAAVARPAAAAPASRGAGAVRSAAPQPTATVTPTRLSGVQDGAVALLSAGYAVWMASCVVAGGLNGAWWPAVLAMAAVLFGATVPSQVGRWFARWSGRRPLYEGPGGWSALAFGLVAAFLVLAPLANPRAVSPLRSWLLGLGAPRYTLDVVLLVWVGLIAVSLWRAGDRSVSPRPRSGRFLLICAAVLLAVVAVHRACDHRYQRAVVAGYADEMSARLGSDWRRVYLPSFESPSTAP